MTTKSDQTGGTVFMVRGVERRACPECAQVAAGVMADAALASKSRLRVRPLARGALCSWCGDRRRPDVPALGRELAAKVEDACALKGWTRQMDAGSLGHSTFPRPASILIFSRYTTRLRAISQLAGAVLRSAPDEQLIRNDDGTAYLERWWLRRPPAGEQSTEAVYLHALRRADVWPPHDHPWHSAALVVSGALNEQVYGSRGERIEERRIVAGDVVLRSAEHRHLLVPLPGSIALTVFVTGRRRRQWGFLRPDGMTGRDRDPAHGLAGKRAGA